MPITKVLSEQDLYDFLKKVLSEIPEVIDQSEEANHFYGSFEEAQAKKSNGKMLWPAVVMGPNAGKIIANNIDLMSVTLYILKQVEKENFAQHRQVRDECKVIGMAIIERINKYRHADDGAGQYFQHFHTNEVGYSEIGSTLDNSIGYKFTFNGGSQRNIQTDL